MAGQSHTHTHFRITCTSYVWIYFCTYCQCCRPKEDISGPEFQTEVCGIIVMVKKLIDSILVTVSDLDF